MDEIELGHLERITNICANRGELIVKQANRIIELAEARGYDEVKISDLEAANILLNNTINVQLQVIREHQAADVIAVEAIRAQEAELKFYRNQFPTAAKNWAKVVTSTNILLQA